MRSNTENPIRINHIGFVPDARKRFVIEEPPEPTFTVVLIRDVKEIPVYSGTLTRATREDGDGYIGDFSQITEEGDYCIRCGGLKSRFFVIYKKAYDNALRTMLQYFTYQRCGSDLGWAGKCHLDDGYIAETGKHVDLSGGYHQSCDLRKSPAGISIGVLGLIRAAMSYTPVWKRLLEDEIAWACDYYVKTIQQDGRMYNTLSEPFGWEGRKFYESAAPASAQWNVVSILALGAEYLGAKEKYLPAAIRAYEYLVSDRRPEGAYHHPVTEPRGMDPESFFCGIYKGSVADFAYNISAARDLFSVTGDEKYLRDAEKCAAPLLRCADPLLRLDSSDEKLLLNKCIYTYACAAPAALDSGELRDILASFAEKSLWGALPVFYSDADLDAVPIGHPSLDAPVPTLREKLSGQLHETVLGGKKFYYCLPMTCVASSCCQGIYIGNGGENYAGTIQSMIDNLLGVNALDSSHIEGVGFNQILMRPFGQFFPSTPQIPGAIGVGYNSNDHMGDYSEYDMPCVGLAMQLIASAMSKK